MECNETVDQYVIELHNGCYIILSIYYLLHSPVDFLRYDQNRFAHAAAFGATAGACLQIFEKKFFLFGITAQSSAWLQSELY